MADLEDDEACLTSSMIFDLAFVHATTASSNAGTLLRLPSSAGSPQIGHFIDPPTPPVPAALRFDRDEVESERERRMQDEQKACEQDPSARLSITGEVNRSWQICFGASVRLWTGLEGGHRLGSGVKSRGRPGRRLGEESLRVRRRWPTPLAPTPSSPSPTAPLRLTWSSSSVANGRVLPAARARGDRGGRRTVDSSANTTQPTPGSMPCADQTAAERVRRLRTLLVQC